MDIKCDSRVHVHWFNSIWHSKNKILYGPGTDNVIHCHLCTVNQFKNSDTQYCVPIYL